MDDLQICHLAIQKVQSCPLSYCKFLTANDTGLTGGHQSGIYVSKVAIKILFESPGIRGENNDKYVKICWQDDFTTDSRFIYYGKGTRNEYRITRFNRSFPFLTQEHTGDLFVLCKNTYEDYSAYILSTDEEINTFLDAFGMNPTDTDKIIQKENYSLDLLEKSEMNKFIDSLVVDFPSTNIMSNKAQEIYDIVYDRQDYIIRDPDKIIVDWTRIEYRLFRYLEQVRYNSIITTGFDSVDEFIEVANIVLNRRKSRAGKSLENHLSSIFDIHNIIYASQQKTEGNKKPDFIFPTIKDYHDLDFSMKNLVFLGAKTTCKDRWRQILNEANRIPVKHLFTLQQGISPQQLDEMKSENIILVVPRQYINTYPREHRDEIWSLKKFVDYILEIEGGKVK